MVQNVVFDILVVRQENLKQFEMFKKEIFTRALIIHLILDIVRYLVAFTSTVISLLIISWSRCSTLPLPPQKKKKEKKRKKKVIMLDYDSRRKQS